MASATCMTDDPTPPPSKVVHDALKQARDPSAPVPDSLKVAWTTAPEAVALELVKEGMRNERRLGWFVEEVQRAIDTWLDQTYEALMPLDVFMGSDDERRAWLEREGFHVDTHTTGPLGTLVLMHGDREVSRFELKGTLKSKLNIQT